MSWDIPPEPSAGAVPYYEFPPNPGYLSTPRPAAPRQRPGTAPSAAPLPLREAIRQLPRQYWKVLTKPGPATFAAEMGKAERRIVWVQLLGYAATLAIFSFLSLLVTFAFLSFLFGPAFLPSGDPFAPVSLLAFLITGLIISALIFVGTTACNVFAYLFAKAFGGQGRFIAHFYTTVLFQTPLGLLAGLLALLPYPASLFAAWAVSIYGLVLQVFSLMAVHRLSGRKASAAALIPVVIAALLVALCFIFFLIFIVNLPRTPAPPQ